ncbi:MAG: hypothetical protein ACKV2T_01395 [Kofleriaceae bacterium]
MILHLTMPGGWTSIRAGDAVIHRKGRIGIRALPIRELPENAKFWIERSALKGAPAGTKWTQRKRAELVTRDGWPAVVVEVVLAHETFQQVRVIALYQFLTYASGAEVHSDPEDFAHEREAIYDILQGGRPDWGPQETVSLPSLLEGVVL